MFNLGNSVTLAADKSKFVTQETNFMADLSRRTVRTQAAKRDRSLQQLKQEKQTLSKDLRTLTDSPATKSADTLKPTHHTTALLNFAESSLHQFRKEQSIAAQAHSTLLRLKTQLAAIQE